MCVVIGVGCAEIAFAGRVMTWHGAHIPFVVCTQEAKLRIRRLNQRQCISAGPSRVCFYLRRTPNLTHLPALPNTFGYTLDPGACCCVWILLGLMWLLAVSMFSVVILLRFAHKSLQYTQFTAVYVQ